MKLTRRDVLKGLILTAVLALVGLPEIPILKDAMTYRLGKKPASNTVKLKLGDYLDYSKLPTPPANFGHETLVSDWQILANDTLGCCAISGPFHGEMLWCAEGDRNINVDNDCVIKAYSAITGYDPSQTDPQGNNPTDQGSNVEVVAEYWRSTGLTDAAGDVHKIDCYVALEPGNVDELLVAMYLFDGVGIGLSLPSDWLQAARTGQVWDVYPDPEIAGGHYVLGVGQRNGCINVITWGKSQLMTHAGYAEFNDESLIYLSEEKLANGRDLEGFDLAALQADMLELTHEPLSVPPQSWWPKSEKAEESKKVEEA